MCTIHVQNDSLSHVNYSTFTLLCVRKTDESIYKLQHVTQYYECRKMHHSLKTENRLQQVVQQVQWKSPEGVQCHDFITGEPKAVPGWHFSVWDYNIRNCVHTLTHILFLQKKAYSLLEIEDQLLHQVAVKQKLLYLNVELYMYKRSTSLAIKQAPYELCSLYRTKVLIIFSVCSVPKYAIAYDFCTTARKNCRTHC
jgi:hypothetical protein